MSASPETSSSLDAIFELPPSSSQSHTDSETHTVWTYEPDIIKRTAGECLWYVPAIKESANFCKTQLKAINE